jgi:hypothetical protein
MTTLKRDNLYVTNTRPYEDPMAMVRPLKDDVIMKSSNAVFNAVQKNFNAEPSFSEIEKMISEQTQKEHELVQFVTTNFDQFKHKSIKTLTHKYFADLEREKVKAEQLKASYFGLNSQEMAVVREKQRDKLLQRLATEPLSKEEEKSIGMWLSSLPFDSNGMSYKDAVQAEKEGMQSDKGDEFPYMRHRTVQPVSSDGLNPYGIRPGADAESYSSGMNNFTEGGGVNDSFIVMDVDNGVILDRLPNMPQENPRTINRMEIIGDFDFNIGGASFLRINALNIVGNFSVIEERVKERNLYSYLNISGVFAIYKAMIGRQKVDGSIKQILDTQLLTDGSIQETERPRGFLLNGLKLSGDIKVKFIKSQTQGEVNGNTINSIQDFSDQLVNFEDVTQPPRQPLRQPQPEEEKGIDTEGLILPSFPELRRALRIDPNDTDGTLEANLQVLPEYARFLKDNFEDITVNRRIINFKTKGGRTYSFNLATKLTTTNSSLKDAVLEENIQNILTIRDTLSRKTRLDESAFIVALFRSNEEY